MPRIIKQLKKGFNRFVRHRDLPVDQWCRKWFETNKSIQEYLDTYDDTPLLSLDVDPSYILGHDTIQNFDTPEFDVAQCSNKNEAIYVLLQYIFKEEK